jgi:hypothetical protein
MFTTCYYKLYCTLLQALLHGLVIKNYCREMIADFLLVVLLGLVVTWKYSQLHPDKQCSFFITSFDARSCKTAPNEFLVYMDDETFKGNSRLESAWYCWPTEKKVMAFEVKISWQLSKLGWEPSHFVENQKSQKKYQIRQKKIWKMYLI